MDNQNPEHHDQFDEVLTRLESANNILVTVKSNPNIDQLSSLVGLTLALNKIGKHATAVFSGAVPSVIEFLKPEQTIETNTNSLRDFIIAIDKSKADKLRYKVEGDVVKIFITPYKTSLSDKDLEFSQGDFNIDAIVGLGVHDKTDLDKAIVAHGKILHDATVISITNDKRSELGNVLWVDDKSSSLCEMVADVARELDKSVFDEQISTAFLTGIVAETDRFSNAKTTPHAMSVAGVLMSGGANAQLISTKLEAPKEIEKSKPEVSGEEKPPQKDGTLTIEHASKKPSKPETKPEEPKEEIAEDEIDIDQEGKLSKVADLLNEQEQANGSLIKEPPTFSGQLTANTSAPDKAEEPSTDPMSSPSSVSDRPMMSRKPAKPAETAEVEEPAKDKTLEEIEKTLQAEDVVRPEPIDDSAESARAAVELASVEDARPEPAESIGAMPLGLEIHENNEETSEPKQPVLNDNTPPPPAPPPMMPPNL